MCFQTVLIFILRYLVVNLSQVDSYSKSSNFANGITDHHISQRLDHFNKRNQRIFQMVRTLESLENKV